MARSGRPEALTLQAVVALWLERYESPHTRAAYRNDLEHFGEWSRAQRVNPFALTEPDLQRYRAVCEANGAQASTVARRLSAIASFSAFAYAQGDGLRAPSVDRPTLPPATTTEPMTDADVTALLTAADEMGTRAAVLIRLLLLDGLKVGQVVDADAVDVAGTPPSLSLTMSASRVRVIALHPDTAALLAEYLDDRRSGPLVLSEHRARAGARLTRFGVDYLVKQAAEHAGIASISANSLRRQFLVRAYERGDDIEEIRQSAGHSDARTTRRYLQSGDREASRISQRPRR
jgi:integrase/recombinase XerD